MKFGPGSVKFIPRIRRRVKRPNRWIASLSTAALVANNAVGTSVIVSASQYAATGGIEREGPTLAGIVGHIEYVSTLAAVHTLCVALICAQEQVAGATFDPTNAADMSTADVLWWWMRKINATAGVNALLVGTGGGTNHIRTRRRLKEQRILLIYKSSGGAAGNTGELSFALRSNLRGDMF